MTGTQCTYRIFGPLLYALHPINPVQQFQSLGKYKHVTHESLQDTFRASTHRSKPCLASQFLAIHLLLSSRSSLNCRQRQGGGMYGVASSSHTSIYDIIKSASKKSIEEPDLANKHLTLVFTYLNTGIFDNPVVPANKCTGCVKPAFYNCPVTKGSRGKKASIRAAVKTGAGRLVPTHNPTAMVLI